MKKLHLYHQPRKTVAKGTVNYYSIASSYREDGKNKKKIIHRLGRLTQDQADFYRSFLKNINEPSEIISMTGLRDISIVDEKRYLDVLFFNELWKKLGLNQAFSQEIKWNEKLSTEQVAKILTINRLLSPSSKIKTMPWLSRTMLPQLMDIDEGNYKKSKIFDELDHISSSRDRLQKILWNLSQREKVGEDIEVYYFDGTTSWFEGTKSELAECDLEKTRGFYPHVVSLMILTHRNGLPLVWTCESGKTKDTSELKNFVKKIHEEFGVKEITYCFDRGVASLSNFELLQSRESKFISGIRDNQIKSVFDLDRFQIVKKQMLTGLADPSDRRKKLTDGFISLDRNIFFKDLGVQNKKRHIVSFNMEYAAKERLAREENIHKTLEEVTRLNQDLSLAERARDFNKTERELLAIFSKYQTQMFFSYQLKPRIVNSSVESFLILLSRKEDAMESASKTDGLMVYVTDHIEKNAGGNFCVSAFEIVSHYKGKYVIENLIRLVKSVVKLRPFHVWKKEHVSAHYDIAMLAAYINQYITLQLQAKNEKEESISLADFYSELKKYGSAVTLKDKQGNQIRKMKPLSDKLQIILKRLELGKLISPALHTSHNVFF